MFRWRPGAPRTLRGEMEFEVRFTVVDVVGKSASVRIDSALINEHHLNGAIVNLGPGDNIEVSAKLPVVATFS
jgi:hypothetical protein